MIRHKLIPLALTLTMALNGCGSTTTPSESVSSGASGQEGEEPAGGASQNQTSSAAPAEFDPAELFTDRDMDTSYDESSSALIQLNGTTAESDAQGVEISEDVVTITDEGTYILSGSLEDGMVIVDAEDTDKVQLVFNGASITNGDSAAVYIKEADKVFITTAPDSENTLTNGGEYVAIDDNNIDGVIFSKADLTLNGEGTLTLNAQAGHGVVSKDDLKLTSGTYVITAASHGLSGKDRVCIAGGTLNITSGKDGIQAENDEDTSLGYLYIEGGTFQITAEGDGLSASSTLWVEDGDYNIVTGGGSANAVQQSDTRMERPAGGHGFQGGQPAGEAGMEPPTGEMSMEPPAGEMGMEPPTPPEGTEPSASSEGMETMSELAASETAAETTEDTTVSTKGLKATASLVLNGGTFNLDCADDGLHSNGNLTVNGGSYQIATGDDGMHADGALTISEGDVEITQSYEGIEGLSIDITGGDISLVASDDGLNAAGGADGSGTGSRMDQFKTTEGAYISISGGTLRVDASGDGIDSNGDLYVTGGEIYVSGPTNGGNSTLDYTGEGVISGGVFCGTGSLGMAQNFGTSSTQGVMMVSVDTQAAGTTIRLLDGDGQELGSWQADKEYSSVIVSCPEITQGATYTLEAGDTTTEVVMDSLVYGAGGMGGPRGGAGAGGGRGGMRNPDGQGLGAAQGVPEAQKGASANPAAESEAGN